MGAVYCEIHGGEGSVICCEHIHDFITSVNSRKFEELNFNFSSVTLTRLLFTDIIKFPGDYCYCSACSQKFGFKERSFSNLAHLTTNPVNIYRFSKQSFFTCVRCIFREFWEIDDLHFSIYLSNLNTTKILNPSTFNFNYF